MSEGAADAPQSEFLRTKSLALQVYGGRVFAHNATIDSVDNVGIELKCWWSPSLASSMFDRIIIGSDVHDVPPLFPGEEPEENDGAVEQETGWRLGTVPIVVELHRIDRDGMVFNKSTGKPQGLGRFSYSTASSESRDKRPMVFAWTVLGPDAFDLVRDRLLAGEQWDFQLLLSVMFPDGAVTYNDFSIAIEWDGVADLDVTAASVVWQRHDWNPSYDTTHRVKPARFVPEPEPSGASAASRGERAAAAEGGRFANAAMDYRGVSLGVDMEDTLLATSFTD